MARTVDPAAHAARRAEFLDGFQRLLATKGYEQLSTQDVLDEVGVSRGLLYHYFGSKRGLLEALAERSVAVSVAQLEALAAETGPAAIDKLNGFFRSLAEWKTLRRDAVVEAMRIRASDDNALVSQVMRSMVVERVAPLLGRLVAQGVREQALGCPYPAQAGRILVALIGDLDTALFDLFFAVESGTARPEEAEATVAAYTGAIERVLGADEGAITLVTPAVLRAWFDPKPDADSRTDTDSDSGR
ncbi:TetR/AcrR family transcriptional regulator [Flindersiella endophytica]